MFIFSNSNDAINMQTLWLNVKFILKNRFELVSRMTIIIERTWKERKERTVRWEKNNEKNICRMIYYSTKGINIIGLCKKKISLNMNHVKDLCVIQTFFSISFFLYLHSILIRWGLWFTCILRFCSIQQ